MAARKKATEKQATTTAYVVLEMYDGGDGVMWLPVLNQTAEESPDGQPRLFEAASKAAAIRQHTGTGEDIKPGTWKAIPWSSWKGGETTRTKVTAERLPFDEGV